MAGIAAALGLVVVCLTASALPAAAKKKKLNPAAVALFEKAIAASDIEAKGSPAFRLQATVRMFGSENRSSSGMLVGFWTPDGQSREETIFPGYQLVMVSDGKHSWTKNSLEYVPYKVAALWDALAFTDRLRSWVEPGTSETWIAGPRLPPPRREKGFALSVPKMAKGSNQECTEIKDKSDPPSRFCFDAATGHLLEELEGQDGVKYEYSNYEAFGEKNFPRTMRVFDGMQGEVAELQIDRIDSMGKPAPGLFLPLAGAREVPTGATCGKVRSGKLLKMVQPNYPHTARMKNQSGTVLLYGYIGTDGAVRGLWVLKSPALALTSAAYQAVRQWRYRPSTCMNGGENVPMPVPTEITVIFEMDGP